MYIFNIWLWKRRRWLNRNDKMYFMIVSQRYRHLELQNVFGRVVFMCPLESHGIKCAATTENASRNCAHCKDSDQPAHSRSLIKIFTERILDNQSCKVSSWGQRRLWSDFADAQADLSLRWAHMSEGTLSHVTAQIQYVDNVSFSSMCV